MNPPSDHETYEPEQAARVAEAALKAALAAVVAGNEPADVVAAAEAAARDLGAVNLNVQVPVGALKPGTLVPVRVAGVCGYGRFAAARTTIVGYDTLPEQAQSGNRVLARQMQMIHRLLTDPPPDLEAQADDGSWRPLDEATVYVEAHLGPHGAPTFLIGDMVIPGAGGRLLTQMAHRLWL